MSHCKIIHIGNIGNIGPHLVNELRRRGYDALSVGYGRTDWPHAQIPTDLQFQSKDWTEFYSVVRRLSEDFQIVHIHYCHVSPSATAILLKVLHHKIVIMHAHGNDVRFGLGRATPVRNLAMRMADSVIASTPDLLSHIPRDKAEFLGQPVNLDTFKLTSSDLYANLHDGVDFVLFHPVDPNNRYTTWIKGTHHVLEAMQRLEKEYSVRLIMTRDILYSEMPKFYSAVDAVLDQFYYGSLTNVALETMACERPLVTDFRHYEAYKTKPPCLPARSGDKIHDAVASILDDKSLRLRLGSEGREFVSAEHSIQHITDRLLCIYHRILRPSRRART